MASGSGFRVGHIRRLEATDLIVFITVRSTSPVRVTLAPDPPGR
jgi:hypothetical protein